MNVIVILNYNDYVTTIKFIKLIENYSILDKILIVDNNSSDGSFSKLLPYKSNKIDIIKTPDNKGYAYGNNCGIKFAEENYRPNNIIISNPDIFISEEDIITIINILDSKKELALATGVIHDSANNIVSNFAWRVPNYVDLLSNALLFTYKIKRILGKSIYYKYSDINKDKILYVEVVPGCFFIIKDEALKRINYFDEDVFLFQEENMLGYNLKRMDYKSCIVTNAKVIHYNSISINKTIKSRHIKNRILLDSTKTYLKKYLGKRKVQIKLYSICFWFGRLEVFIYNQLLKLRKK